MTVPPKTAVDAWARRELKVEPDAPPLEVRQAALRLVGRTRYAPTIDDCIAIGVALNRPRDSVDVFQKEAVYSRDEESLRLAMEEFTRDFFKLSPGDRTGQWRELHERSAAFPWWRTRLDALERSLTIEWPKQFASPVAEMIFQSSLLAPPERAAQRREILGAMSSAELVAALEDAKRVHPEILQLPAYAEIKPQPPQPTSVVKPGGGYVRPPAPQQPQSRRWSGLAIVFVVITALRILTADSTTPRRAVPAGGQGMPFVPRPLQDDRDRQLEELLKNRPLNNIGQNPEPPELENLFKKWQTIREGHKPERPAFVGPDRAKMPDGFIEK